jgi:hypothetical protein
MWLRNCAQSATDIEQKAGYELCGAAAFADFLLN